MSSTLLRAEPTPAFCRARWATPRQADRPTRGNVDAQVAELLGWSFFPWQHQAADVAGEYDPATRLPVYRTVGISVARQNGKTTLICSRIARQLILPRQTIAYTAQDRGLARLKWAEHVELLMQTPFAAKVHHVDRVNHREMLVMRNGSRYLPVTPSAKKAGRSLSIDLAVIDEARTHDTMAVASALRPTMVARAHAQLWICSNAGDETSGLWRHYTKIGRAAVDDPAATMAWFEWAAEPDADVHDPAAWAAANPSLGLPGGVTESGIADAAGTLDGDTFRAEHLNLWTTAAQSQLIDAISWALCEKPDVPRGQLAVGLAVNRDRDAGAVVASGLTGGNTPLEVIEVGGDVDALADRAAELGKRWACPIVVGRTMPAASAIPRLERATAYRHRGKDLHRVVALAGTHYAQACGDFYDAALHARLSHRKDFRLTDAVAGAGRRLVGKAWEWEARGDTDITPLEAATLARWGAMTAPVETRRATGQVSSPARRRLAAVPGR